MLVGGLDQPVRVGGIGPPAVRAPVQAGHENVRTLTSVVAGFDIGRNACLRRAVLTLRKAPPAMRWQRGLPTYRCRSRVRYAYSP
jgi:hypothetical protein